jgi:hypothetical protein
METLLTPRNTSDAVVLLHGLGRTRRAMVPLEEAFQAAGYRTLNRSYDSRRHHIESLARAVLGVRLAELRTWEPRPTRIHFVTHSLGGILVRWFANHIGLPEGGRAVMIAPPHAGSEAADALQPLLPAQWWFGPVLQELGTGEGSVPLSLGPVAGLDVGVIAGDRATYPFFARRFEDAHDGLVSVASTRVEGAVDAIVVPSSHSFIAAQPATIHQAVHFVEHGGFDHASLAQAA